MNDVLDETVKPFTLNYLQDTLFGVNPFTTQCMAQVTQKDPCVQIKILPPWPAQLEQSHTITLEWDGGTRHGVVKDVKPLATGELLLAIETRP